MTTKTRSKIFTHLWYAKEAEEAAEGEAALVCAPWEVCPVCVVCVPALSE